MKHQLHPARRRLLMGAAATCALSLPALVRASSNTLVGAGASLPTKLYESWGQRFTEVTNVAFGYAAVGSGQGWRLMVEGAANFGTTEIPYDSVTLEQYRLIQFPVANAAIVLVANLPGLHSVQLRLTPSLVSRIFTGQTRYWRDPAILALNPHIEIPDLSITPVSRVGRSGTTFALSRYLTARDDDWRQRIGVTAQASWNYGLLAIGTSALEAVATRTLGAIGYLVAGRRLPLELSLISLGNGDSGFLKAPSKAEEIDSWPLLTPTFALLHQTPRNTLDKAAVDYLRSGITVWGDLTIQSGLLPLGPEQQQSVWASWQRYGLIHGKPA